MSYFTYPYFLPFSSLVVDLSTLAYDRLRRLFNRNRIDPNPNYMNPEVSVIVPAYNEEDTLERCVTSILNQTAPPKNVIIVDDHSTDRTPIVCARLKERYDNLIVIRKPRNRGKADSINLVVRELNGDLGELTLIVDSDSMLEPDFIEEITEPFLGGDDLACVHGKPIPIEPDSLKGKLICSSFKYTLNIGDLRRRGQSIRNAVNPVVGGLAMYPTKILEKYPIPIRTKTEDTDHNLILAEHGLRRGYQPSAAAYCVEPDTFKGWFRQYQRYYAGGAQSLLIHGKDLFKAKMLLFTNILPISIENIGYTITLLSLPFLAILDPEAARNFLIADFLINMGLVTYFNRSDPKEIPRQLVASYLIKGVHTAAWLSGTLRTIYEQLTGQQDKWKFGWARPGKNNEKQLEFLTESILNQIPEEDGRKSYSYILDDLSGVGRDKFILEEVVVNGLRNGNQIPDLSGLLDYLDRDRVEFRSKLDGEELGLYSNRTYNRNRAVRENLLYHFADQFVKDPEKWFSISDLTEPVFGEELSYKDRNYKVLYRNLEELVERGVLVKTKKNRRNYYQLNPEFRIPVNLMPYLANNEISIENQVGVWDSVKSMVDRLRNNLGKISSRVESYLKESYKSFGQEFA